ncbi:MAG: arginine--tRNA ligase [Rhodothermales bacterium]
MQDYLEASLRTVLTNLGVPEDVMVTLETPNNPDHGDLATNAALQLARVLRKAPRQIAEDIKQGLLDLPVDPNRISGIEIAGPGFLNFRFSEAYLTDELAQILTAGDTYGRTTVGAGQTANVEYVSANPTGPLTVGHGRNAVLGDTLANLLDWTGYDVTREYYFNDAGRQMRVLGQSVKGRYDAIANTELGTKTIEVSDGVTAEVPATFPDDGYLGEYIIDIAQSVYDEHGDTLLDTDDVVPFKRAAEQAIFADIEQTLKRLGIEQDTYFNERSLYESESIWSVLDRLREQGHVYDADGAVWLRTTNFGKDKDTVLVKSSGEPTYRLPDIAYHANKLERGYAKVIDIFGADHIATYPDVLLGVELLGYDKSKVDVVIYQFVTLIRGGQPVKMSTRKANFVTLDELMEEVGEDVTRFFFLMRSPNTHLEFDLDLAKEASDKNPVFYLQYAHARICAVLRKAEEVGFSFGETPDLSLLTHDAEINLTKTLLTFPQEVQAAADAKGPHKIATYLREVAAAFSKFYDQCHIIGEDAALATARMNLALAARIVLKNGLTILGISAPERM